MCVRLSVSRRMFAYEKKKEKEQNVQKEPEKGQKKGGTSSSYQPKCIKCTSNLNKC